ncbi:class I SAM-dependent methyltransferase [Niabella insulamsoli]|uniref:class I SAM-dependent methyltransferase n=1 Tax=Niabella insulamsoli TaxID=3144874 RepID=UPI0031FBC62B
MHFPLSLQTFTIGHFEQELFVPDPQSVKKNYEHRKGASYWAKVWPAALGLCHFLAEHPDYISGKTVLELAAGLGLPGIFAARYATHVTITDRDVDSIDIVQQSAQHLRLENVSARALDWKDINTAPSHEVLLLSDVNYEPAQFESLHKIMREALQRGTLILLSSPQRLVARQFLVRLLPFSVHQKNYSINTVSEQAEVGVFVLKNRSASI